MWDDEEEDKDELEADLDDYRHDVWVETQLEDDDE